MHWYLDVLKKYAMFSGRARRQEYWMYTLMNIIVYVVLLIIGSAAHVVFLPMLYAVAVLLPSLAVAVRRLHDTGRSGWWLLISVIPAIGGIILLVFLAMEGNAGDNSHGPDPKFATVA